MCGLTQAQRCSVVLPDADLELAPLRDGLGGLVVDLLVQLDHYQVVVLLLSGVRDVPETVRRLVRV